jgi:ribose transport system permease protein
MFLAFGIFIDGFLHINNLLILFRSVSVLGIFGVGMAIVVIGRGIDLSQVSSMAISTTFVVLFLQQGVNGIVAIGAGLGVALLCGLANGLIIAFLEIPAIFATLGTSTLILGGGRYWLLDGKSFLYLPGGMEQYLLLGQGRFFGIPIPILVFAAVALLSHLFLTRTRYGSFISAIGDNDCTAVLTGIAVRPLTVLQYVFCILIAFIGGLVYASSIGGMDVRIASSTQIVDVILVVVLGGVSLAGGRGTIRGVVFGTIMIGMLLNGMTILNLDTNYQDIFKGIVLLGAMLLDNQLNPRNEEISRQGEDL